MKKGKEELKTIPKKNYVIVFVVSILVVAFTFYVRSFYLNYEASKTDNSVFASQTINQINIDDLEYAVNEATDSILFISYNKNAKVNLMERKLYKEIEKKGLNDKIIYLNVTEYMENDEYLNILRNKIPGLAVDINKAPMFIYIKDGQCIEVIDSSKELIGYKSLDALLSKYEIE